MPDNIDPELRKIAEELIAKTPKAESPAPSAETLLHELQVHQIELEMQNEALQQAQIELEESRDRYVNLYEFAPVGYLTLTAEGMIAQINLTAITLLGVERAKLLRRGFTSCVMPEDHNHWIQTFMRVLKGGKLETVELVLRRGDTVFHAQLDCVRQTAHTIGLTLIDITERKKAEDELKSHRDRLEQLAEELKKNKKLILRSEKLASIGTLSAGVAHEVLNPLNIIGLLVQLQLKKDPSPEFKECLEKIKTQVGRATKITNALREFSHLQKDEVISVNLPQLFDKTITLIDHDLKSEHIVIERLYQGDLPKVFADENKLSQLFLNLLTNARDILTGKPSGKIIVEMKAIKDNIEIRFSDNGAGIPHTIINKIFDPFFTTKDPNKGTGLGLYIAHTIIENMGGTIDVTSELGKGTVFTIHIPIENSAEEIVRDMENTIIPF